jgi:hypothetical protein
MDVTDDHEVALGIEKAQDAFGGIDVLNRGFVEGKPYMNKSRGLTYGVQVETNW